jgi:hypothetical protein
LLRAERDRIRDVPLGQAATDDSIKRLWHEDGRPGIDNEPEASYRIGQTSDLVGFESDVLRISPDDGIDDFHVSAGAIEKRPQSEDARP